MSPATKPQNRGMRNVISLGFVSLFTDISSEMTFSVLPVFIVKDLGATKTILGLIEGSGEATGYVFRLLSGTLSDRLGKRKLLIFLGYAASNVLKPLFALSTVWQQVLQVRLADRVGKGVRTAPRDALLSETASKRRLGLAFGLHRALDQVGAIIGPGLAFLLIPILGFRGIFIISLIPGTVALLILVFYVRDSKVKPWRSSLLGDFKRVASGKFLHLVLVVAIFSAGAFNFSFVLLRSSELGISDQFIPLTYAILNLAHTGIALPAGIVSDKIGKEKTLLLGYVAFAATCIAASTSSPQLVLLIPVLYGAYFGIFETIQRALVAQYSSSALRATAYGLFYLIMGGCFFLANLIVGYLWENLGPGWAFTYSLVTTASSSLGLLLFMKR